MRMTLCFTLSAVLGLAAFASPQGWTGDVFTLPTTATTLTFKQGLGQLVVQAGTVAVPTPIFLGPSPLAPELPTMVPGSIVAIGRPMLKLLKPVTLKLAYDQGNLPANVGEASLRVYKLANHKWVAVGGTVDTVNNVVSVNITQPATFALIANTPVVNMANELLVYEFDDHTTSVPGGYIGSVWHDAFSAIDLNFLPSTVVRRSVGKGMEREYLVSVSPSYNAIFYCKWQPNGFREGFSANADGSHPQRVTNLGARLFGEASLQGDGRAGVVCALVNGQWNLYRMNVDGSAVAILMGNVATSLELGPPVAINPAGTQAVVGTGGQVHVITVATGALVRTITIPNATTVHGLTYHPGGTTIAIAANNGLFTAVANAGSPLLRVLGQFTERPAYSPDGTRIAVPYANGVDLYAPATNSWVSEVIPYATQQPTRRYRLAWR